jgi:hypothetical protein
MSVVPRCNHPPMRTERAWVCQCRRCHGVHSGRDAVQEVWESALGSCDVPIVVGVNVGLDGRVVCSSTYWHGEPEQPRPLVEFGEYIVSCRPGEGTVSTEGDIARWVSWEAGPHVPRDWLLVDRTRFRSVRATVDALRSRWPLPGTQIIAGDWDGPLLDPEFRARTFRDWPEAVRRNRARSRL